ncbi:hypothetical protein [Microcoleus sp. MON2_D5]|uniref:hypothetical protein n=1 Tax=Microcoleus sp. MON2_D5 TaxID=2818833 RepID=UPI002FD41117
MMANYCCCKVFDRSLQQAGDRSFSHLPIFSSESGRTVWLSGAWQLWPPAKAARLLAR